MRQAIRDGLMIRQAKARAFHRRLDNLAAVPSYCRRCGDCHAPAERCAPMIGETANDTGPA